MSDFAYDYFQTELDRLEVPELEQIMEKIQNLLSQKKSKKSHAAEHFFALADTHHGNSHGQKWTREELYER